MAKIVLVSCGLVSDEPDPSVLVIRATSLCPTSRSIFSPRLRSIVSWERIMCLVGPYGVSGKPRITKNSRSCCGSTTGGIQFENLLLMRSKRRRNDSKDSPSFIFSVKSDENSANNARVVLCILSSRIVCRSGKPAP